MAIPTNAIIRAVAQFQIGTVSRAQNIYHFEHVSVVSKTDQQVVTACGEFVVAAMQAVAVDVSNTYVLEKVECFIEVALKFEPIGVATPAWAGGHIGERLPSGVALLVRAFKERSGYADKKFLGGFVEATIAGDEWIGSTLAAAAAFAAIWTSPFVGSESTLLLPGSYTPLTGQHRPYTGYSVATVSSYQRRRKPGVGLT